ncbi:hypothetical protein BGZ76_010489 [Entomortierella beljakovae]|nr:hypothetical protein BGZ76_010489 [Entomortierella beljakovae]
MKPFTTIIFTAAALVATVSADMLQINNPTDGTVWKTGVPNFVGWTGNCASMGNDSKAVKVDLVNGPSTAVRYVATLGTLDCSGSNTRADMTVPSTVPSGQYAIVVRTSPQQSYTNSFQIDNPSQPAAPPTDVPTPPQGGDTPPTTPIVIGTTDTGSTGSLASTQSSMGSGAMLVFAGAVALGLQLL